MVQVELIPLVTELEAGIISFIGMLTVFNYGFHLFYVAAEIQSFQFQNCSCIHHFNLSPVLMSYPRRSLKNFLAFYPPPCNFIIPGTPLRCPPHKNQTMSWLVQWYPTNHISLGYKKNEKVQQQSWKV